MKRRILDCVLLVIVSSAVLLVLLLTTDFLILCLVKSSGRGGFNGKDLGKYKLTRFDPTSNSSNTGFATIQKKLERDDFISYEDKSGARVLISNFESQEYVCHGMCSCEQERRGSGGLALSRGIVFLVAGVSSLIAFEQAKKRMDDECAKELDEDCTHHESIRSIIDFCSSLFKGKAEEEKKDMMEIPGSEKKRFVCSGTCIPLQFFDEKKKKSVDIKSLGLNEIMVMKQLEFFQEESLKFGCEKLKMEKEMKVVYTPEMMLNIHEFYRIDPRQGFAQVAKVKFIGEFLEPFCEESSLSRVNFVNEVMEKKILPTLSYGAKKKNSEIPMCSGHVNGENRRVSCLQTSP